MANDIFRRVEKKYLLTRDDYESLMDRIWFYIKEDTYFKSNISNIYYDSCDNELIINSIDKPVFKEKVRVRSYVTPKNDNDEVFLEIKRKFKGVVGKRRVKLTLKEFYDFVEMKMQMGIIQGNVKVLYMKDGEYGIYQMINKQ